MNRFRPARLLCALATLALGVGLFQTAVLRAEDLAVSGQPAPAWKLKDPDGREVSSDQFKGKVVIVDFWATWCQPCISEIPGYIELQKKYGPAGLVIVGVAYREFTGPATVKKFAQDKGMNYAVVIGDETIAEAFGGIEGIPSTFLINRDGRIVHHKLGAMPHEEYEKIVQQALN